MKNLNKTPVKQRPFRGVKKRIAKKYRYYDQWWFEHKDLKVGDVVMDHDIEYTIKSIRVEWDKFTNEVKDLRCKWYIIGFTDGSYPCGCNPLLFVRRGE